MKACDWALKFKKFLHQRQSQFHLQSITFLKTMYATVKRCLHCFTRLSLNRKLVQWLTMREYACQTSENDVLKDFEK